tara:strand:- start:91 stop:831 length:741 start_codon:yes stop_codon:yes gene_type:complete
MPSKKRNWAKEQALRLEARLGLGKADAKWRVMNGLSQQNCHDWSKASRIPIHNSQVAYWERGSLDPKGEYWFAREAYNLAIAENDFPPGLSRIVRDRMKAAEPFLTHDGRVATALDFQAMFGNRQPINPLYTKAEELTNDFLAEFAQELERTFKKVARENMFSNKECWDALCQTKSMKQVKDKNVASLAQDILRGERVPTIEEAKFVVLKYKQCPACIGLKDMTTGELSKKIVEANSKLTSLVMAS